MLYLLDANILITANRDYYPMDQVPEFWSWLQFQGTEGNVKIPLEILEELRAGTKENDRLFDWISLTENESALRLDEPVDVGRVRRVLEEGYAPDLNDVELEAIGQDPFLIAYCLGNEVDRCVVTAEASRPSTRRQNRRVPIVCEDLGVQWCGPFKLNRALGFRTAWKS